MKCRVKKFRRNSSAVHIVSILFVCLVVFSLTACGGADLADDDIANNTANNADNTAANNNENTGDNAADNDAEPDYPPPTPRPTRTLLPEKRIEDWLVDLEWPDNIFLGESDVIRLTMEPSETGLIIEAEFSNHKTVTKSVPIERPTGYLLNAVADLQSPTFDISPTGPQARELVPGKSETWHWSISPQKPGRHRLFLMIKMAWEPLETGLPQEREFGVISHAFEIQVDSYYGLSRQQASLLVISLGLAFVLVIIWIIYQKVKTPTSRSVIKNSFANPDVQLEPKPDIVLTNAERTLLQTVFSRYARVVVEKEFMSGYSGARTFMTTPIHADNRADAYSIVKISGRESINREYQNYQNYVKDTLPPTTARIQETPISVRQVDLAALRYTFIGAPGNMPQSLRQIMERDPDPSWFELLASSYGPSWWLQRKPYTFRLSQEYDRKLPAHYVLRPAGGKAKILDGRLATKEYEYKPGDLIRLEHFQITNINPTRNRISLVAQQNREGVPLKVTYLSADIPNKFSGEIIATRETSLQEFTAGLKLFDLPNPLERLPNLLNQTISGTRSIIHGDLNLENILIGPGGIIWLIDFAETKEGHTLFDFAHLFTEVIAHILSGQYSRPEKYLNELADGQIELLNRLEKSAGKYLFNFEQVKEFKFAAAISSIGALKYTNLNSHAKQLLYLTAAYLIDAYL